MDGRMDRPQMTHIWTWPRSYPDKHCDQVWKFSLEKYSSYGSTKKVWADGQTDNVISIGHPLFSMRGPKYSWRSNEVRPNKPLGFWKGTMKVWRKHWKLIFMKVKWEWSNHNCASLHYWWEMIWYLCILLELLHKEKTKQPTRKKIYIHVYIYSLNRFGH